MQYKGAAYGSFIFGVEMTTSALEQTNDNLVLIGGESGAGKSACLMNLRNHEGVLYLNCEAGKKLPFRNKFKCITITQPSQVFEGFDWAETQPDIHTIVIDSVSFLMEMFESLYIIGAADSRSMWGEYAQFFKNLMQQKVAKSSKNVIMITHIAEDVDEATGLRKTQAKVKGALKGTGIEAYFSLVINVKKIPLRDLEAYPNDFLNVTEEDKLVGYKHVFQTRITKNTTGERIRGPMGMFTPTETFIDNDAQKLLDVVHEFYNEEG